METKLTLRMDAELIEGAKAWARARGISLSRAVAGFFEQLRPEERGKRGLDPLTRRLLGVAPHSAHLTDERIRKKRLEYLRRKHG
ncbi:MAG: hypothetical protein HYX75_06440 [Acidobacteria bacterium]|nr:hypothetical protein [Acidobacteriota bacterium]